VLELSGTVARYATSPLIAGESPLEWGREEHVRQLFGDRVSELSLERRAFEPSPIADVELLKRVHPLVVALYRELADRPDRTAALDRELSALGQRRGETAQEVLLIVAHKREA
jgi:hypothetical protein